MTAEDAPRQEGREAGGGALVPLPDAPVTTPIPPPAEPVEVAPGASARIRAARWIAVGADVLQILVLPAFLPGALSPVDTAFDLVVAIVLVSLLGWHPALLPSFIAELVPFVDLLPTWTAAVLFVTRRRS